MIINKHPSTTFTGNFQISVNSHTLKRESVVKYLGILIDQNLNWSAHTKQLSLQLSRYAGLLYKTRKFLGKETLSLIYYTLIYSTVQYGITIWGSAKKTHLHDLSIRLNNIVRIITNSSKFCPITRLYKNLNFLKLEDIYKLKLAKYMYKLHHRYLPSSLMNSYTKIELIHVHNTRQVENITFYKPRINKSIGKNLLVYRGNSIWNEINNSIKKLNWNSFKKQYKKHFIET